MSVRGHGRGARRAAEKRGVRLRSSPGKACRGLYDESPSNPRPARIAARGGDLSAGTVGYRVLEHSSWWDSFFMTVITVTTVGYEEEVPLSREGEVFTSVLLLAGLGVLLFLLTEVSRSVLEGELRQYLGRVRRSRMIERLVGHEIVCVYGRMGQAAVEELRRAGHLVVVVERSPGACSEIAGERDCGHLWRRDVRSGAPRGQHHACSRARFLSERRCPQRVHGSHGAVTQPTAVHRGPRDGRRS